MAPKDDGERIAVLETQVDDLRWWFKVACGAIIALGLAVVKQGLGI